MKNLSKNTLRNTKKILIFVLIFTFLSSNSILPFVQIPFSPTKAYAADTCTAGVTSGSPKSFARAQYARVGGVSLDQAAKFLVDMNDITGAYYDSTLDRIVFIGKKDTVAPKFDRDDLAVAVKSVIYNKSLPQVNLDTNDPADGVVDITLSNGLTDTKFGKTLIDADWKLKLYVNGYDENNNKVTSSVSTYKSAYDRYVEKGPTPGLNSTNAWWITPKLITLKKDDTANAFIFNSAVMEVKTVPQSPNNDPKMNQAAQEFADEQTANYDAYAQETPAYYQVKQLGKIVAVLKWISDAGIASDFEWARDYTPKYVATPRHLPQVQHSFPGFNITGGVNYQTANTYNSGDGTASSLKSSSQAVSTSKEDVHWTFTNGGQQYEAVAVTADAFRSMGSYNTSVVDLAFPTVGDLTLAFQRTYSSFSGGQYGIGKGWNIFPATLYDNNPTANSFSCANGTYTKSLAFISQTGGFESFTINDCAVGYIPDDPAYHSKVTKISDGTISVLLKDQTEFKFSNSFKLVQIKDKNGNALSYNYDAAGKLTSIADSKGHQITLTYGSNTLISSVSDWTGRSVAYTYDIEGNLLTVKDPNNNITTYTYDTNAKLTGIKDRKSQLILTNTYNDEARVVTQKDEANITNNFTYDKVNKKITATNNQIPNRTQTTVYDTKGRILSETDPLNFILQYTYGNEFAPLTIKDKRGNTVTYTYDTNGNTTSITYPNTTKVTNEYDVKNRLTRTLDYRYGATPKESKFVYDTNGNLTQLNEAAVLTNYTYDLTGDMLTLTNPLGRKTTWTRDSFGNPLTQVDANNNSTTYTYDSIGRLTRQTDADNKIISYTYDANNNVLTKTDGAGKTTNVYDKENNLVKVILPNNTVSEFVYNSSNEITSVKDQALNTTAYGYDVYQNLTKQTDALNRITNNTYDALNRQTQSTTPLGKVSKWEYDANGNITKRIDANNAATLYLYDNLNRLTKITYSDTKTVTFEYDNRGNRTKMIDPVGTSTFSYDNFDRLTQATNPYGHIIKYQYDTADNLTQITYPDNAIVKYAYDGNNRLTSVTDWGNRVTTYTYNKNGTLATRTYPNTITTTYLYDNANRVKEITSTKATTTISKFQYERDSLGNIKVATESGTYISTTPKTTKFSYDALGRIINAIYPNNNTYAYTYDKVGNRIAEQVVGDYENDDYSTSYTYDNDNRLTIKALTDYALHTYNSFTYDNNSNMTKKPSQNFNPDPTYTYDFENRLTKHVTSAGNPWNYKYDGLGNRLEREGSTAVSRYVTDMSGDLSRILAIASGQGTSTIIEKFIYGLGVLGTDGSKYYVEDGLGNVRLTTTSTGGKSGLVDYDPYGRFRSFGDIGSFQFQQQWLDTESGNYFLRARYYDPELGRFLTRDPKPGTIEQPQSQNPYAYALNNPINLSDPSGEQVAAAVALGGGALVACTLPVSGTALVVGGIAIGAGIITYEVAHRWKVGDDHNAPTSNGEPSWPTIRSRFWKNEANKPNPKENYTPEQLDRMKAGKAPQQYNDDKGGIESKELSHEPIPKREGGKDIVPRWPQEHAEVDPLRHPGY